MNSHSIFVITDLQDYQPLNTTVATVGFLTLPITTIEDGVDEDPETFFLRLELVEDTDISIQLSPGEAVVTILDDDSMCNVVYIALTTIACRINDPKSVPL